MCQIITELLHDCSTQNEFIFSLRCAECGSVWKSKPIRFSKAKVTPKTEGKRVIFDTLYKREKAAALELAIQKASELFSQCPICRRWVCDHCFLICEELDMCVSCAHHLKENGSPVMEEGESI